MRSIEVSIDVFSAIWAQRLHGEGDEDAILRRLLCGTVSPASKQPAERVVGAAGKPIRRYDARWIDDVEAALKALGGRARLVAIYEEVRKMRRLGNRSTPPNLEAVVRKELEMHSSDSDVHDGLSSDLFYMPEGKGAGVWAVR